MLFPERLDDLGRILTKKREDKSDLIDGIVSATAIDAEAAAHVWEVITS